MDKINTIGRRKTSVARLYLSTGKGNIQINQQPLEKYFPLLNIAALVKQPLVQLELADKYDIKINVKGGGFKGQAEAIRLALSRALCEVNAEFRPSLKKEGFLTRDPRMVERKKYGHRKARKSFPFRKR